MQYLPEEDRAIAEISELLAPFTILAVAPEADELPPPSDSTAIWRQGSDWYASTAEQGHFLLPVICEDSSQSGLKPLFDSAPLVLVTDVGSQPVGLLTAAGFHDYVWRKMRQTTALLHSVLATVNDLVCAVDTDNRVLLWNDQAEERYKIKREEILGRNLSDFFSDLVITKVQRDTMDEAKTIRNKYHQPVLGSHVLSNASPVVCGDQLIGAVAVEREITETMRLSNELARSTTQIHNLKSEISKINKKPNAFEHILGRSQSLLSVIDMAQRVANTDVSILLRGESGTGKELFAEAIHRASSRSDKPFVVINCGAIPANLFESEIFGYQPGSFTGADRKGRKGKFDEANHGTLFLDEIGELSLDMQVKLLRVLQNQKFYRVGGGDPIEVDVRLISATNRDLEKLIEEGNFRDDLYYRINVVSLEIPPLRERRDDISQLTYLFVREFCVKQGISVKHIEPDVINYMMNYSWPGNIRELRNIAERMVVLSEAHNITADNLPGLIKYHEDISENDFTSGLNDITGRTERELIIQALEKCNGDRSKATKLLGIPRSTLYYKLHKYQIDNKRG
ncbi:MAG: sigma 54-interacting transcriptional regulator [Bacillota bacterium]|nr:sigma 54-interacting transcriptional regulator [Bacillota bacterium]